MTPEQLFLASDAALRDVVDQLTTRHLSAPAPQEWTQIPDPTIRDIVSPIRSYCVRMVSMPWVTTQLIFFISSNVM